MSRQRLVFLAMVSAAALTGCQKEDLTPPPPAQSLTARAGADQDVLPASAVTLDGSTSTGEGTLTYHWTIVRKPSNSTLTLGSATSAKPSFTPDIVGYYEFELTVRTATDKSTDRVQVKAEYPNPVTLDKDITANTRLFDRLIDPAKPDYIVAKDIAVKAELLVDRDVTMAFERDKRLTIEEKGVLNASGTAEQRIRLTGTSAQKSFWAGVSLYSPSTANSLAFVDVEYAGSRIAFTNTKAGLALFGNTKAQLALTDCRFLNNDGYGLYVQNGSVLRQFARNTFKGQNEAPVLIDAYNATLLDAATTFTGQNGRDVVEISSSSITGTQDVRWPAFADKTPYRLLGNVDVTAGWTLQPGVTVEVARDAMITINKGGYLSAKGTTEQRVTLTGSARANAHWKGLIVYSVSNLTVLDQADISGAGSTALVSGQRGALAVYGKGAKLTVKNSRISGSGGYGILYTADAELNSDAGSTNTFSGNAQGNTYKL